MKTKAMLAATVVLFVAAATPVFCLNLNIGAGGGTLLATGKEIDKADPGYSFKGLLEAEIWNGFSYGVRYSYSNTPAEVVNNFNNDTTVASYNVNFAHHAFHLTNTWSPGWRWVDPYIRGAAGINIWEERLGDTLLKAVIINSSTKDTTINEVKAASFGIGLGGGISITPVDFLSLRLGVDYDIIFSENKEKFGSEDANENLLRVGGELVFRIPIK